MPFSVQIDADTARSACGLLLSCPQTVEATCGNRWRLAAIGLLAGSAYRYFVDDPDEATFANYLRSGLHGMGVSLSGWVVHLYFTSRSSAWVTKWPLVIELFIKSVVMARDR